jgi:O-acetyl-ADP-ribose deacetylase (regulator of RNase III)
MAKSISEVKGDLLTDKDISIIIHQVKTTNKFDGGLAAQIRVRYPAAWRADVLAAEQKKNKLGSFSFASVGVNKWVFNIYSESTKDVQKNYTDYNALRQGLTAAKKYIMVQLNSPTIGIGHIGVKAGGDWNVIRKIVEEVFTDYDGAIKIVNAPGS